MVMTVFAIFVLIYLVFRWKHLKGEWNSARLSTRHMTRLTFAIWLLGLLVAWHAPLDVLDTYTIARSYTNIIGYVFPLDVYSSKSNYPQVSTLYNSIAWPLLPVLFVLSWRNILTWRGGVFSKDKSKLSISDHIILTFLAGPFFLVVGIFLLVAFHGGDTRNASFGSSRMDLALWGLTIPIGVAFFIAVGIASFKKSFLGKL